MNDEVTLVIKIPRWFYEETKEFQHPTLIDKAIMDGTLLPKGHGRMMDYGYVVDAIDDWVNAGEYNYTNATDYLRNRIRNVPTIIEAERENKE